MIGLGTNRLSASRLAGLREARQFRNGQWLEGLGSWFSPYSAAATRALKAAFPNDWEAIRDYGWEHPEIVPYVNDNPTIGLFAATYDGFGDMIINNANDLSQMDFAAPIIASKATDNAQRMRLVRSGQQYTDWSEVTDIVTHYDWQYLLGDLSTSAVGTSQWCSLCGTQMGPPRTLVKFFVPTEMPTGINHWFADGIIVNVNGTEVFSSGSYHNNLATATIDFSNIIKLNDANYMVIAWRGSGGTGCGVGFSYD